MSTDKRKYHQFSVSPVLNGFIVNIGCQTVAFTTPEDVAEAVTAYMRNPNETERAFLATSREVQEPVNVALGRGSLQT